MDSQFAIIKHKGEKSMKISVRNVLKGVVKSIDVGAVNTEVVIDIKKTSIMTKESNGHIDLKIGEEAYIIVKANNMMIDKNDHPNPEELLMAKTVGSNNYKIDPSNPNLTKPRTWGTFLIQDKNIDKKRYRFGNYPIRMEELKREYASIKLVALFKDRKDAEALANLLENG